MFFLRKSRRGIHRDRQFRDLHSRKYFRRVLERERARTDRSGDPFSLLSLSVTDWNQRRVTLLHLAKALRRRLRITDEAGWLGARNIGVVLPCTPARGAWSLAEDLCRSFPEGIPLPLCKVFSYPSNRSSRKAHQAEGDGTARPCKSGKRPMEAMETLFFRRLPVWKRGLDILGSLIGLLLLSPLLVVVALVIKLTSRGPVFFAQMRSGQGGEPFVMYKFRSMVEDAEQRKAELLPLNEQDGPAFKIKNDPRVTRVGRILRTTSIDELPQLWNVLRGEMSLVGPRPLPCEEAEACRGWQRRRLDVTPGLTCIWQVEGRSSVAFADWARMDVRYIRSRSLVRDVLLLLRTIPALIFRKGW